MPVQFECIICVVHVLCRRRTVFITDIAMHVFLNNTNNIHNRFSFCICAALQFSYQENEKHRSVGELIIEYFEC